MDMFGSFGLTLTGDEDAVMSTLDWPQYWKSQWEFIKHVNICASSYVYDACNSDQKAIVTFKLANEIRNKIQ